MSRTSAARACALLALVAALTGACGGDDDDGATVTTTAPAGSSTSTSTAGVSDATTTTTAAGARTIDVAYAGGQVTGGVRTETVRLGDEVALRVTSDVAEEVHVHTYDVMADVTPGETAEIRLTASIPGRFEVELEKRGKQLLVLEVR